MAKYDRVTGEGSTQDFLLEALANELAESNRLKRIELRQQQGYYEKYVQREFNQIIKDET